MKITSKRLKLLIKESFLKEGRRQIEDWINRQPEDEQQSWRQAYSSGLVVDHMAWIKRVRGNEPIEDIIGDVVDFLNRENQQKINADGYATNLSILNYPTVNSLRNILDKINTGLLDPQASQSSIPTLNDSRHVRRLGRVGKWEILLPITEKGSVACDFDNPKSTTWCTTKRSGANQFYNYIISDSNIILFYVMDYSRRPDDPNIKRETTCTFNNDSRLCIGYENDEAFLYGEEGGISIDASNAGLEYKDLKRVFGENFNSIMNLIDSEAMKIGENHPGKKVFKEAAKNIRVLKHLTRDLKPAQKEGIYVGVSRQKDIAPEVLNFLLNVSGSIQSNYRINQGLSNLKNLDEETTMKLYVRMTGQATYALALQKLLEFNSIPTEIIEKIISGDDDVEKRSIAANPRISSKNMSKLWNDSRNEINVRSAICRNPGLSAEFIEKFAKNPKYSQYIALNPSITRNAVITIMNTGSNKSLHNLSRNPNIPNDLLKQLMQR
jgi:hypothetical protein